MAWHALWKWFTPWSKRPYVDQVARYRRKLYDDWFQSLPEGEKARERKRIQRIREKEDRETKQALAMLLAVPWLYRRNH